MSSVKLKQSTVSLYQAPAQSQVHLQFAQNPAPYPKIAKELAFLPPTGQLIPSGN